MQVVEGAFEAARRGAAGGGNPGAILERLYSDREQVLYQHGDYLVGLALCQVVFSLDVKRHGVDSYQAAFSLGELADAMRNLGHPREADAMFQRALATA